MYVKEKISDINGNVKDIANLELNNLPKMFQFNQKM